MHELPAQEVKTVSICLGIDTDFRETQKRASSSIVLAPCRSFEIVSVSVSFSSLPIGHTVGGQTRNSDQTDPLSPNPYFQAIVPTKPGDRPAFHYPRLIIENENIFEQVDFHSFVLYKIVQRIEIILLHA